MPGDRWLLDHMASETLARLATVARRFETGLIFGHPVPALVDGLKAQGVALPAQNVVFDEDRLPFADASFDLIVANGGLDSVNDLPGALLLIRRALRNDGLFIGAMMGARSLPAARQALAGELPATRRFHPQIDIRAAGDLMLRAGFFQPVVDGETATARYSHFPTLVRDLRANGLSNAMPQPRSLSRIQYQQASAVFAALSVDGKTAESFAIIHMTGWSSQAR